uniref:Uncharacterized protein n=1 Tax=Siphoviridae sp. ct96x5 TaxID=2825367 RepID=A0A8S5PQS4_9CAUD|nr:MAG TPA: hypothetical protein [Siphoviridae sp. ct96x5]
MVKILLRMSPTSTCFIKANSNRERRLRLMNDLKDNATFSFGKVELGVVPEEADIKPIDANAHTNRVNIALCNKMDAVDALDALRHNMVSNLSKAQYVIIRNSLEEMADLIREYEGKPAPVKRSNDPYRNNNRNNKN